MKGAIRRYCNEGHDILTASDMHEALRERRVKGSSAIVCELDCGDLAGQEIKVNPITNFSAFHNFSYEQEGLRLSKAYGIGEGKLIPWSDLIITKQGPILLKEVDNCGFFTMGARAIKPTRNVPEDLRHDDVLFECQEPGCRCEFSTLEELEDHNHLGRHSKSEGLYDGLRRDWAAKFSSLTLESRISSTTEEATGEVSSECSKMGWALQKPKGGGTRFSDNVKVYLTEKFDMGETTGRKADPAQVSADMKKAKNTDGTRKFKRSEWLTKTQVQGYFSRLAAKRRKTAVCQVEEDDDEDSLIEDEINYLDEKARGSLIDDVVSQVGLIHPVTYDGHDICQHARLNTLTKFNVTMLKAMCTHFELPYRSRDLKSSLVDKLKDMVKECTCWE